MYIADPQEDWHAADLISSFSRESLMSAHLSAEEFVNLKQESCRLPLIVIRSTDNVTSCSLQEVKCLVVKASDKHTLFPPS